MAYQQLTPGMTQSGTGTSGLSDRLRRFLDNPNDASALQGAMFPELWNPVEGQAVRAGLGLAQQLTQRQDANNNSVRGFVMGARDQRNAAQAGAGNLDLQFGQAADAATGQSLDNWRGLSDYLGGAGITGGGLAAGMGAQIELGRMGQITEAQRDISIKEADRRSRQASDNFLQDLGLGSFLANDLGPSATLLDQINGTAGWMGDWAIGQKQVAQASADRAQAERDSKRNFWGSIIGGGLGLGGSLLG